MKTLLRYGRFNLVGGMGMLIQLGALWILNRSLPGHYLLSTLIAVELAVLQNFFWHVRYTWRDRGGSAPWPLRLLRFQLSNGAVSLGGNALLMRLLVGDAGLPVSAANLAAIACCSLANFWLGDVWAFRSAGSVRGSNC
jgi:putative flippase GtrA